jgi:dipeptidyl aminopeptidase/acylaminoacyl peptidase
MRPFETTTAALVVFATLGANASLVLAAPPAVIRPPANVVAEGVQEIPRELVEAVGRYTEARGASFVGWHPRERQLLVTTRFGSTSQVHRVAFPGGARTQLTFFPEPVTAATYEPVDGRYLLFTKDQGGDELAQIHRLDFADGRVTLLTDGGRSQNGAIAWSTAGDRIAYASTRRNGTDRDIYVMDPVAPRSDRRVVELTGGGWAPLDWSPDDRRLLAREYRSVYDSRLWEIDLASGSRRQVSPDSDEPVAWSAAAYHPDGRSAYVLTDSGSELSYLAVLDLASGQARRLSPDHGWDVVDFDLSRDGSRIAYEVNEAGLAKLFVLATAGGEPQQVGGLPVGVLGRFAWHPDGRELGLSLTTAHTPSDVYSFAVETNRIERWTASEVGPAVVADLPDPRLVHWPSFDGREISGFLFEPPARFAGKRPVIVAIHGGPEGQAKPDFWGRWNYFLAELGIALLEPNVRGSTGYGKSFVRLDDGERREDSVKDIGALFDWIAQQPTLDAERVLVSGGSYGGYMALAVATLYPERIRGAIDVVGISSFVTFLENTEDYRRDLRRVEYGDERDPRMRAFLESISPLHRADRIRKPLLVVQGANDPRVPRSESEQMVATARGRGAPVWYLLATDEGHGFRKKENADFQFYTMVEFVRRYLVGDEEEPAAASRTSGGRY